MRNWSNSLTESLLVSTISTKSSVDMHNFNKNTPIAILVSSDSVVAHLLVAISFLSIHGYLILYPPDLPAYPPPGFCSHSAWAWSLLMATWVLFPNDRRITAAGGVLRRVS